MSNKDELVAINSYVQTRSQPKQGAPAKTMDTWRGLKSSWDSWYPGVINSWYVSDEDLANGKARRNALMKNADPASYEFVQQNIAAGTAGDAPKPASVEQAKHYWATHASAAKMPYKQGMHGPDVMAIQRIVGASPDGNWGPKTTSAVKLWQTLHHLSPTGIWGIDEVRASSGTQNVVLASNDHSQAAPAAAATIAANQLKPVPGFIPEGGLPGKPKDSAAMIKPENLWLKPKPLIGAGLGAVIGGLAFGPVGVAVGAAAGLIGGKEIG